MKVFERIYIKLSGRRRLIVETVQRLGAHVQMLETKGQSTANLAEEGQVQRISFLTEVVYIVVGDVYSTCTAKSRLCERI